jgi:hypothetical protein
MSGYKSKARKLKKQIRLSTIMNYNLPVDYTKLNWAERRQVREQYIKEQDRKCYYCGCSLDEPAPKHITEKKINWKLFPKNTQYIYNTTTIQE